MGDPIDCRKMWPNELQTENIGLGNPGFIGAERIHNFANAVSDIL